jgi:hypothetical protein
MKKPYDGVAYCQFWARIDGKLHQFELCGEKRNKPEIGENALTEETAQKLIAHMRSLYPQHEYWLDLFCTVRPQWVATE